MFSGRPIRKTSTGAAQMPRGDEAITAIIARSSDDRDLAAGRAARHDRPRHGGAGILHQHSARRSRRDRQPVGLAHVVIGEKFQHAGGNLSKFLFAMKASCDPNVGITA
jgi:hypothetical protein